MSSKNCNFDKLIFFVCSVSHYSFMLSVSTPVPAYIPVSGATPHLTYWVDTLKVEKRPIHRFFPLSELPHVSVTYWNHILCIMGAVRSYRGKVSFGTHVLSWHKFGVTRGAGWGCALVINRLNPIRRPPVPWCECKPLLRALWSELLWGIPFVPIKLHFQNNWECVGLSSSAHLSGKGLWCLYQLGVLIQTSLQTDLSDSL